MLHSQQIAPGLVNAEFHEWQPHQFYQGILGVRSPKGVYYWFKLCDDGVLIFDHAYSQIVGTTSKAMSSRITGERLLCRLAGLTWEVASSTAFEPER